MKKLELNIGLASRVFGDQSPEKALNVLGRCGFTVLTWRVQASSSEDGSEDCLSCQVLAPENWEFALYDTSLALGQDCIAVTLFIGRKPYEAFNPDFWIKP